MDLNISFDHCEGLNNFLKQSRGDSASLVFASSFLGSPTSYFGHTFIKINKKDNAYFSSTIGYAAELPQYLNFIELFSKGISGGYIGRYVTAPYYQMTEAYSVVEQRTLYEYKLDLTYDEIEDMLWHAYEIRNTKIPYKFFKENCAYELFWFFEVARPDTKLRENLKAYVIPYETIQYVKNENMVLDYKVRPPLIEQLYQIYGSLSEVEKKFFATWRDSDDKQKKLEDSNLSTASKNKLAELINGHYDILFKQQRTNKADFNDVKRLVFTKGAANIESDFEPKKSHMASVGLADVDGKEKKLINFRPVLFNRFEERDSLLSESTLEFLNIGLSRYKDNTSLENIDIVKIESFNKRFDFYEPMSWRFYAGANRSYKDRSLKPVLETATGYTKGNNFISCYALAQLAIYPSEPSVALQSLAGVSLWLDKIHLNIDYKNNLKHYNGRSLDEKHVSLFYPINHSASFSVSNDFQQDIKKVLFEYKF